MRATGQITSNLSDQRLKDIVAEIHDALGMVQKIRGVYYNPSPFARTVAGGRDLDVGLLAQEVQQVLPHVVKPAPFDTDENDESISGENYLTLQYERIVPLLVEAVKCQGDQLRELDQLCSKKYHKRSL